ncbi:F-actin-monooxygenase Mical isoform X6 [Phlebotomus argentipes]|uniref:F-actin-monooxygenase Mical isoform X6 n=1 Tax=Phlebotomus argentipes TaxID=94469 RepID=UPI00289373D2|nr:F-actin-monooxygenase Mical isoform X6 [Phlebotomus argentipes]
MEGDNAKLAAEMFDHFCGVTTMRQVMGLHRNMLDAVGLRPGPLNDFYPKLKAKIRNWKAQALWKKFDARAAHRVYNKGTACSGIRVLVIGAGPCGLRTAIEAQLLGAKVVVVEKRDRISRNNVLHLWPFVITDLRNLGAKKFYGKFCAGSIDHISIRQLQCILLKVALLLGVEVHEGVSFVNLIEPRDGCGWRAQVSPEDHAVSHYEFDALIGADGKRNTLEGFVRKEFRGKLAIAITANFINKRTEAEAKVEEISGVAFIFNQSFFKELYYRTGIDLENIVYYKDETHYFVMTAKKMSLIDKGVIMQDSADPAELLAPSNVNTDKLLDYAREAAEFSTKYQMPNLEFAVNHYGKPDVAMFDFTSMFQAENSSRISVRKNYRLLQCLVGDSLLEPFWPTGSGCARGFLSSMDAAYAIKLFASPRNSCLAVLAQRESLYRLLGQTTPENLNRDIMAYTLDPSTRYPNLNKTLVQVQQVEMLLDSDDTAIYQQTFMDTNTISAVPDAPVRRKRRTGDTTPLGMVLLRWIKSQLKGYEFSNNLTDVAQCFTHGKVLCALIHRYRPDLVDFNSLDDFSAEQCNARAFDILENDLGIPRVMQPYESVSIEKIESKIWLNYLEQICELFRGEIPHVKHPKLDFAELKEKQRSNIPDFSNLVKSSGKRNVVEAEAINRRIVLDEERNKNRSRRLNYEQMQAVQTSEGPRRAKKRRSHEKFQNVEEQKKRLEEIQNNRMERQSKRRLQRARQTENFYKSLHMLQFNSFLRDTDSSTPFEDYSLYVYRQQAPDFTDRVKDLERKLLYPDRERGFYSALPRGAPDEKFSNRIKSMESKIVGKNSGVGDKKPKDLLRAIGKIESDDWNVREIEKKIEQSKKAEVGKSREKVPKWSREQFLARQSKMAKPIDRQVSIDEKFKEIDMTIKSLDKQLKEGHNLDRGERGRNKVASIAGQFGKKTAEGPSEEKAGSKSLMNSKLGLVLTSQGVSEICHFCKQKVYLMEKISAEGLVLHRSCLKCHHCHTNLRLGGYAFDRDSPDGLFYCNQHFKLPPKPYKPVTKRQPQFPKHEEIAAKTSRISPEKASRAENIVAMDLLDRGQTPERIEFENTDAMSDGERSLNNIIDENEWTDRNFGTGTDETDSDLSSSDSSDSETDSDLYEEAIDSPLGAETLQLATDWIGKQRICSLQDSDGDEFYDSSEDDDVDTQTEGEELARAREIRMQEVKLQPPIYPATDTETEVVSKGNEISSPKNDRSEILWGCKGDFQVPEGINQLNEKLYNLNHFLNVNKDINALKKENFVRDDMLKKQNLKEQWLSNVPVAEDANSRFARFRSNSRDSSVSKSSSVLASNVGQEFGSALDIQEIVDEPPSGDEIFKDCTPSDDDIQLDNLVLDEERRDTEKSRASDDLLTFEEEEALLKEMSQNKLKLMKALRDIDTKNFKDTLSAITCQTSMPKVTAQSSVDLSKYFPEAKKVSSQSQNVNKNQKELKNVDLSKYFAQSQPSGSKPVSDVIKLAPLEEPDANKSQLEANKSQNNEKKAPIDDTLCESDFNMFDQLLDGAIDLKMFMAHIERIEPQKVKITQPKIAQKMQKVSEYSPKMARKQEDDNISVVFEEIFDFDNDITDIDNLLSDNELDKCNDMEGKMFDDILFTRPGEKVNAKVAARKKRNKKTSFRDRAINAQGDRGIETRLLPPKPKVIRDTTQMAKKKVKTVPKREEVSKSGGKSVTTSASKETGKENARKIASTDNSNNPKPQKEIVKIPNKPTQIQSTTVLEKKVIPPKELRKYVSDPKMCNYFFNDIPLVEDTPKMSLDSVKTPEDCDENKIMDDFEQILQDMNIDDEAAVDVTNCKIQNIKIMDHVQEICDKIDRIEISDNVSHSLGDRDTLSRVWQDQINHHKANLDQFIEKAQDKQLNIVGKVDDMNNRTEMIVKEKKERSRERSQGKINVINEKMIQTKISQESQDQQPANQKINRKQSSVEKLNEEPLVNKSIKAENPVENLNPLGKKTKRSRERSLGKTSVVSDKIISSKICDNVSNTSSDPDYQDASKKLDLEQSTVKASVVEPTREIINEHNRSKISFDLNKEKQLSPDKSQEKAPIVNDKIISREIKKNVSKIRSKDDDQISNIKVYPEEIVKQVFTDKSTRDDFDKHDSAANIVGLNKKKQRSRERSQGKKPTQLDKTVNNTPESSRDHDNKNQSNVVSEISYKMNGDLDESEKKLQGGFEDFLSNKSDKMSQNEITRVINSLPELDSLVNQSLIEMSDLNHLTDKDQHQKMVCDSQESYDNKAEGIIPNDVVYANALKSLSDPSEISVAQSVEKLSELDKMSDLFQEQAKDQLKIPDKSYESAVVESEEMPNDHALARSSVSPTRVGKPRDQPYVRDYDSDTHRLLRRSRDLHNKKQEFMNERMSETNPYMKRVFGRVNPEDRLNLPSTDRYYNYPSSILSSTSSRLAPTSFTGNYSTLDSIRRPPKTSRNYNSRDACNIS